jgi:hypothetical protein
MAMTIPRRMKLCDMIKIKKMLALGVAKPGES